MAYRELEEVLPDQEGAANMLTDPPRQPPPQEEPADTPVASDEIRIPQIYEGGAAQKQPPVLVDPPPYWQHHPWW